MTAPAAPGPKRKNSRAAWIVLGGAGAFLVGMIAIGNLVESGKPTTATSTSSSTSAAAAATTSRTGCGSAGPTCDAVPKVDGMYRVAGSGVFDTGISPGWIGTNGPRAGSNHCSWERLSAPVPNDLQFVIDGGKVTTTADGPVYVRIEESDEAFWSDGCQPWVKVSRK